MASKMRVRNLSRDADLADHATVADNFWRRLRGLLGRSGLEAGEGLVIRPCNSVHMLGMRFPLDVLYLDRAGTVLPRCRSCGRASSGRWSGARTWRWSCRPGRSRRPGRRRAIGWCSNRSPESGPWTEVHGAHHQGDRGAVRRRLDTGQGVYS